MTCILALKLRNETPHHPRCIDTQVQQITWRKRCGCTDDITTKTNRRRMLSSRSEEHTSELQSHLNLVCRLLLEKKKNNTTNIRKILTQSIRIIITRL